MAEIIEWQLFSGLEDGWAAEMLVAAFSRLNAPAAGRAFSRPCAAPGQIRGRFRLFGDGGRGGSGARRGPVNA